MARAPSTADSACCWSSICVTSNWNHAPWTTSRSSSATSSSPTWRTAAAPAVQRARSAIGSTRSSNRSSDVGHDVPLAEGLADRAESGAERLAATGDVREEAVRALRLVADLHAEDPRLAAHVVVVLLGQLEAGPRGHDGEAVRRPVVGQVGLEVLDLGSLHGDVAGDPLGRLAVAVVGKHPVEQRRAPRRPRRCSTSTTLPGVGSPASDVPRRVHLAALVDQRHHERAEIVHRIVVPVVARPLAADRQACGEQTGGAAADASVRLDHVVGGQRPPSAGPFVEVVERPLDAALGRPPAASSKPADAACSRLIVTPAWRVMLYPSDGGVDVAVVAVEPRAVVVLVALEPSDGGAGRVVQRLRRRRRRSARVGRRTPATRRARAPT